MALFDAALCAIVLSACPCETQPSGFAGGSGTAVDPDLICNSAQLALVANNLNGHYRLIDDIDMTGVAWTPIAFGTFTDDSLLFNGTIDGGGFSISNLTAGSLTQDVIGFIGRVGPTGVVRDLHMRNVSIQGKLCAGGLASENRGLIERCSTTGAVTGQTFIGGMIGDNRALLEDCYSQCTVLASRRL